MQTDCHDLLYEALNVMLYYKWNDNPLKTRGGMDIRMFGIYECHPTFKSSFAYSNMCVSMQRTVSCIFAQN